MVACKNEAERKQRRQHCLRIWVHQYVTTTLHSLTSKSYEKLLNFQVLWANRYFQLLIFWGVYALEAIGDEFYGSQLIVSLPEQLSLSWVVHMIEEDSVLCPVLWFAQDEPALRQVAEAGCAVCVPQHKECVYWPSYTFAFTGWVLWASCLTFLSPSSYCLENVAIKPGASEVTFSSLQWITHVFRLSRSKMKAEKENLNFITL